MKKILLILVLHLFTTSLTAQTLQGYYLVEAPNHSLNLTQKTINQDQTLTLAMANNSLETFFNNKQIYKFKKAFPNSSKEYLQRVYFVKMTDDSQLDSFISRQ